MSYETVIMLLLPLKQYGETKFTLIGLNNFILGVDHNLNELYAYINEQINNQEAIIKSALENLSTVYTPLANNDIINYIIQIGGDSNKSK